MTPRMACFLASVLGALILSAGCATGSKASGDPWERLDTRGVNADERALAVAAAWREVVAGQAPADQGFARFEDLFWKPSTPVQVRLAIIEALSSDPDSTRREAGLGMFRSALPFEVDGRVISYISAIAAEQTRTDFTTALVRSLARPAPRVGDLDRSEAKALLSIHGGSALGAIVREVVLEPFVEPGSSDPERVDRARSDAWELLARLDPDGSSRTAILEEATSIPLLAAAGAARREFGVLASSREELAWIGRVRAPAHAAWLAEVRDAIERFGVRAHEPISMRHLEPIRLAAQRHPEWLGATRSELIAHLRTALKGRRIAVRTSDPPLGITSRTERLEDIESRLSFLDALTILVVDELVHDRELGRSLLDQARADRADRSTEHGGMLAVEGDRPIAHTFLPRPTERAGDNRFVASPELIEDSATAVAHYHFHAREASLREYAGPSRADLDYATHFSRTCLVFTSMSSRALGVDLYLPGDLRLDLGQIPD